MFKGGKANTCCIGLAWQDISQCASAAWMLQGLHVWQHEQVADKDAGANCSASLRAAASNASRHPPPKPRFQPNCVDEVRSCLVLPLQW